MIWTIFLYDWFRPNSGELMRQFVDSDSRSNLARAFLKSIDGCETMLTIAFFFFTLLFCISYYTWYNQIVKPFGFHYRRRHWCAFMLISEILIGVSSFIICKLSLINLGLPGTSEYVTNYIIGNLCWGIILFFLISWIWCTWLPTNAYRWFKWF